MAVEEKGQPEVVEVAAEQTATPETTPPVAEAEAPAAPAEVSTEAEETSDGEPGGDEPQAVRARKEYRARVRAQNEANELRLEHARLRGELDALKAPKPAEPELTPEKVRQAMRDGLVDRDVAIEWLAEQRVKATFAAEREKEKAQEPLRKAEADLQDYLDEMPDLHDRTSKAFRAVTQKLNELIGFGYADDARTRRIAVELAHGPLKSIKARNTSDRLTRETLQPHNPAPSGGNAAPATNSIASAPANLKAMWDRTNTSQADREKEFKYYLARQPGPRTPRA